MRINLIINWVVCLFVLILSVFSQAPDSLLPKTPNPNPVNQEQPSQERRNQYGRRSDNQSSNPGARSFFPFKAKRTKDQEKRLKPNAEDVAKYADFLKQPKTGIFRLVNDLDCESNVYVIRADEACSNTIPGGSYYSFREKGYTTAYLADIRFKQGLLISDGILSQNILVRLGDIPLDNLSLESEGVKYLAEFVPEKINTTATKQFMEIVRGVRVGKHEYRKVIPAFENTTYAMRAIAYRGSVYRSFRGWFYNLLDGDKRADLIVVFRVIRKDTDGSVTLLWKELDRKKAPKIEYEKKKKNSPPPAPYITNRTVAGN